MTEAAAIACGAFAAAAALPFALRALKGAGWGMRVRIEAEAENPSPKDVAGYLAEVARRMDERPERMRLEFAARPKGSPKVALDMDADGALRVEVEGRRAARADLRKRWIAEHGTPVELDGTALYAEPVDGNRFRVMAALPFRVHPAAYAASSAAAAVAAVAASAWLAAAAAGLAAGCALAARE